MFRFKNSLFLVSAAVLTSAAVTACDDDDNSEYNESDSTTQGGESGQGGNAGAAGQGGAGAGGNAGESGQGGSDGACNTVEDCKSGSICQTAACVGGQCEYAQKENCCTQETVTTDCTAAPECFSAEGVHCEDNTCVYTRIPQGYAGGCECIDSNECPTNKACDQHACINNICPNITVWTGETAQNGNTKDGIEHGFIDCSVDQNGKYTGNMSFYKLQVPAQTATIVTANTFDANLALVQVDSCETLSCVAVSNNDGLSAETLTFANNSESPKDFTFMLGATQETVTGNFTLSAQNVDCSPDDACANSICTQAGSVCIECNGNRTGDHCETCARGYHNAASSQGTLDCQPNDADYACAQTILLSEESNTDSLETAQFLGEIDCSQHDSVVFNGSQKLYKFRLKANTDATVSLVADTHNLALVQVSNCNDLSCLESATLYSSDEAILQFSNSNSTDETFYFAVDAKDSATSDTYQLNITQKCQSGYIAQTSGNNVVCVPKTLQNSIITLQAGETIEALACDSPFTTEVTCPIDDQPTYSNFDNLYSVYLPAKNALRVEISGLQDDMALVRLDNANERTCLSYSDNDATADEYLTFTNDSDDAITYLFFVGSKSGGACGHFQISVKQCDLIDHCEAYECTQSGPICRECENAYWGNECDTCAYGYHANPNSPDVLQCEPDTACSLAQPMTAQRIDGNTQASTLTDPISCQGAITFAGSKDFYTIEVPANHKTNVYLGLKTGQLGLAEVDNCENLSCKRFDYHQDLNEDSLMLINSEDEPKTYTIFVGGYQANDTGSYRLSVNTQACNLGYVTHCIKTTCNAIGFICKTCEDGYVGEECDSCDENYHATGSGSNFACAFNDACYTSTYMAGNTITGDTSDSINYQPVDCDEFNWSLSGPQNFYTTSVPPQSMKTITLTDTDKDLALAEIDDCESLTCVFGSDRSSNETTDDEFITLRNDTNSSVSRSFLVGSYDSSIASSYTLRAQSCSVRDIFHCEGNVYCESGDPKCKKCDEGYEGDWCTTCSEGYISIPSSSQTICRKDDACYATGAFDTMTTSGNTTGSKTYAPIFCSDTRETFLGPQRFYKILVEARTVKTISLLNQTADLALVEYEDCSNPICIQSADSEYQGDEHITFVNDSNTDKTYYFFVGAAEETAQSAYTLSVSSCTYSNLSGCNGNLICTSSTLSCDD